MQFQAILLTLFTLSSTAFAGCGDTYGRNFDLCEADCPGTCFNRGGTVASLVVCGC
jgi:hypothetical protein